jgi:hypothetical protein
MSFRYLLDLEVLWDLDPALGSQSTAGLKTVLGLVSGMSTQLIPANAAENLAAYRRF